MQPSTHIRARQTREIKRAARHAWRLGRDLNRYVVVNFPEPDLGDDLSPQRAFRAIRTKCCSWWDYKRRLGVVAGSLADMRTWENRSGILHVNWLVHVPDGLVEEFRRKRDGWIAAVLGDLPEGSVKEGPVFNLNGVLTYVLKGTDPATAHRFGIEPVDQGSICGQRARASRSLGRTARERDWLAGVLVHTDWKFQRPSPHA